MEIALQGRGAATHGGPYQRFGGASLYGSTIFFGRHFSALPVATAFVLELCRDPVPVDRSPGVALTADHLPDGDWKDVLVHARRFRVAPPLIVASHVPDARLWSEVLHLGGYDVLTIPFLAREVILSVAWAWRRWHDQWILANDDTALMRSAHSAALTGG